MPEIKVPFYGHVRQYHSIKKEIDDAILKVLESGAYVMGPALKQFETDLSKYFGTKYAIGLNSGTDAIWLVLMSLGIGKGDEVITTANTFFATAEAIWIAGAKAVLVDCDPKTKNIDPAKVEAAITPKTKAIIPVHLYGLSADMKAIGAIAKKHKLAVIEDNAQSIDGHGPGWKQGEFSDAVCTSFIIQKNLGTFGDGGAVVTNNEKIDADCRRLRNHGSTVRSVHSMGYNSRLDDIHAAILSVKLKYITKWTDRRREIAARYTAGLKNCKSLSLPYEPTGYRHAYHLYVVETPKRDEFEKFLVNAGVDAKLHYPIAIHEQKGYPWGQDVETKINVPNCEKNAAQCLSLPMFPELTNDEVDYAIEQCVKWDKAQ
jgi:dTDP-4-amino-4,6-dideoxygalactose transaminase